MMETATMPWRVPRDQIAQMLAMFDAGLRAGALADAFGISERAVHFRLARRGRHYQRPRRLSPVQKLAIEERRGKVYLLRGRFLTAPQMAAQFGIRPRTMRAWLRRHLREMWEQMKAEQRARRAASRKRQPRPRDG